MNVRSKVMSWESFVKNFKNILHLFLPRASRKADLTSSFAGIDDAPYLLQVIPNRVISLACGSISIPFI
jgi:hypothetical protein